MAGGPSELIPDLVQFVDETGIWMGVDRGTQLIMEAGIQPDLAVGDFDSINAEEWTVLEEKVPRMRRFKPEKDETDMELALVYALEEQPETVRVFGATGGRLDHFLANAFLIAAFKRQHPSVSFELIDVTNQLTVHLPGNYQVIKDRCKPYISFIPAFGGAGGLTLHGFKYPLENRDIPAGSSLCISNELIQETGHFSFEKGILMMIRSKD